jgi:hypothetical protein
MVMARVFPVGAGGSNVHVAQAEPNLEARGQGGSVLEIDEVNFRTRSRPGRTSGSRGLCRCRPAAGDAQQQQTRDRKGAGVGGNPLEHAHGSILL